MEEEKKSNMKIIAIKIKNYRLFESLEIKNIPAFLRNYRS